MFSGREFAAKLLSRVARIPAIEQAFLEIVAPPNTFSPPKPKTRALNKMYSDRPQVRAIVSKVSKAVAKHGWYFEDRNGERIDKHPALDFLRAGNPRLRGRQAIQTTIAHVDLTGESFWIIGRKGNKPTMYAPIPADWVRNVPDGEDGFFEIHVPNAGTQLDLSASEVIWFKDVDPLDPYARGSSLLGAASIELSADENAASYLNAQFGNRMRPDLIVSGTEKAPLRDEDVARVEMTWGEKYRGAKKAGKPFFTRSPLTISELGKGARDNQVVELSQMFRDTIYETFGVPPEIFGRLESSNKATIDSADYLFARHTVDPRLMFLLDHIEPFLQENFPGVDQLTLKYESPIAEDNAFALEVVKARAGAFTDNEVRKLAKFKPIDGLDELPEPEPAPGDGGNDQPPNDKKPKPGDEKKEAPETVDKSLSPEDIVRVSAAHEDPAVFIEATQIVDTIFRKLLKEYGADLLGELEAEANFEVNGAIDSWIKTEAPQLVQQINATTRKDLVAGLTEGVAANESIEALQARIDAIFEQAAETRSVLIGQTLATKLTGFGSLEAAWQAGFTQKKWLSSVDQVVRSSHSALNNQVKLLSEKFQSPRGGQAMHPGAFGEAAEDANCRCAMRPVLDGEDDGKSLKKMSDEAFHKFQRAAFDKMSGKLKTTLKNVFLAQKAVAQHQFRVYRDAS